MIFQQDFASNKNVNLNMFSPINCHLLKNISYGLSILLALSIFLNVILLIALFKCARKKNQKNDLYLITITILNLVGSVVVFPFLIKSTSGCR